MIDGAHFLIFSKNPDADRAFFRDVLKFRSVDAGHGWLIFALPPAEVAVHPGEPMTQLHAGENLAGLVLYLMCDDLRVTIQSLLAAGVECAPATEAPWGIKTSFRLPSGGEIGLYQPMHPTAIG